MHTSVLVDFGMKRLEELLEGYAMPDWDEARFTEYLKIKRHLQGEFDRMLTSYAHFKKLEAQIMERVVEAHDGK